MLCGSCSVDDDKKCGERLVSNRSDQCHCRGCKGEVILQYIFTGEQQQIRKAAHTYAQCLELLLITTYVQNRRDATLNGAG